MGFSLLDLHDAYEIVRDMSESDEERQAREEREKKSAPVRFIIAGVLALLFLIGLFAIMPAMDAERVNGKAEPIPSAPPPKVDCKKNPWGIGCAR